METPPFPESETRALIASIRAHPEYLDAHTLAALFEPHCARIIPDAMDSAVLPPIKEALAQAAPFSVVRIGDGEADLLTYRVYPDTPTLDEWAVRKILEKQQDTFQPRFHEIVMLRELMMSAVAQADIVGVKLHRPHDISAEAMIELFTRQPRGISGNWRAVDYLLRLARMGWFRHKIVASAHLYFAVIKGLHELVPLASRLIVVSNHASVAEKLRSRYPGIDCQSIPVGDGSSNGTPEFLARIDQALPDQLAGCLCLIGAGPWSEIYCSWVKQRGGVGIDVGSGLDLLAGLQTRPAHKKWAGQHEKYAL